MSEFSGEHGESHDAKLSESEIKLVARLLSDPTYFPVEFRTWLKNYIEGAGIQITASQIRGSGGSTVKLPAGIILPYAGSKIGGDVLPCDGQAVSRSFYDALWDAVGSTWGPGDGSSTFNVPDFRDRALYGAGNVVGLGGHDGIGLGARGGPHHHHDFSGSGSFSGETSTETENHTHAIGGGVVAGSGIDQAWGAGGGVTTAGISNSHTHLFSGSVAIGGPTTGGYQSTPSYAGVRYAITTGKSA